MVKVLFVCLGNICRSPAAEGYMIYLTRKHNLEEKIFCDSAGTSAYHAGEQADSRMQYYAEKRGYNLPSISRQFLRDDFEKFDYIITMDRSNYNNVVKLTSIETHLKKVIPMSKLCTEFVITDVPDPYYGGDDGFNEVLDIVEDGCNYLLTRIKDEHKIEVD